MMDRPRSRRITYGGRLPGVIYIGPKKSKTEELLARMDRAWTRGAEEILLQIQKEGKGDTKPKIAPSSTSDENIEISKIKIDLTGGGFSKTGGDLVERAFTKIGSSFRVAAASRRAFKKSGGDPRSLKRGYFLSKALGSEFGGDFRRRTRGTFSRDPDATQDPGLSKEERFAAVVKRDLVNRPQMMRQEEISGIDSYTNKTLYDKILDSAKKVADSISGLEGGFTELHKNEQNTSIFIKKITRNLTDVTKNYTSILSEFIQISENKEKSIFIKKNILSLKEKIENIRKRGQQEQQLELLKDVSGTSKIPLTDLGSEEDEQDGQDSGSSNILSRVVDTALDFVDFGKGGKKALGKISRAAKGGFSKVKGGIQKLIQRGGTSAAKSATKGAAKGATKTAGKGIFKSLGKKIPGVGLILGTLFSIDRFKSGDIIGGLGEIASGVASVLPGPGTAISVAIDAALIGKDVAESAGDTKLSSGGIIAGEAGNEAVIPLSTSVGKNITKKLSSQQDNNPIKSIAPILSSAAGIVRNPLYGKIIGPVVKPIIEPLISKYKIPIFSGELGTFKSSKLKKATIESKVKSDSAKKGSDNPLSSAFGWLKNIFKGAGGMIFGAVGSVGNFFRNLFGGGRRRGRRRGRGGRGGGGGGGATSGSGVWRPLLDAIASGEGSWNSVNPGQTIEGLTDMTIAEAWNAAQSLRKRLGRGSGAMGRYQFLSDPIGRARDAGLDPYKDKFSPENQDKMAVHIIENIRSGKQWLNGTLRGGDSAFAQGLANEWAGIPNLNGRYSHPGQGGKVKAETIKNALSGVKSNYSGAREQARIDQVNPQAAGKAGPTAPGAGTSGYGGSQASISSPSSMSVAKKMDDSGSATPTSISSSPSNIATLPSSMIDDTEGQNGVMVAIGPSSKESSMPLYATSISSREPQISIMDQLKNIHMTILAT